MRRQFLLMNSGYYLWWGGWGLWAAAPHTHASVHGPTACVSASQLGETADAALALVSVLQILVVTASEPQLPDKRVRQVASLGFFEYSPIYSVCLPRLRAGDYGHNVGQQVLGLDGWLTLGPLFVVLLGAIIYFLASSRP